MSYARFSETSDVYVFAHVGGFVQCCGCALGDEWDFHSAAEVVAHLREHEEAGHVVPEHLFDEALYEADDFVPMCHVFMCRENAGHGGGHAPFRAGHPDIERLELIRSNQIAEQR